MTVVPGDFSDSRVVALLREHLEGMHASSPPGTVYALDLDALRAPSITFVTAWLDDALAGCGALKELDRTHGELKSMRTSAAHLRRGVGATLLEHLLGVARTRGYRRVSLETGSGAPFEAALALYRRYGFVEGEAFGAYVPSAFNRFLHLDL
ncbi:MAG: GNAT family N-acetyltransferase [Sandaracinus sp.]|nr:GNAT family N-acetyltransferase [Sandaracinus sp.]MCB9620786.1 GNAT family N-acetyltransferase [Sandaracinus sp.]MCB9623753.1 GNAT family N-acetyltransferase [Sandaracinus sp.]MCB9630914.1 GNAT family N-acetyltransferase [Sandaracinus sp.]